MNTQSVKKSPPVAFHFFILKKVVLRLAAHFFNLGKKKLHTPIFLSFFLKTLLTTNGSLRPRWFRVEQLTLKSGGEKSGNS